MNATYADLHELVDQLTAEQAEALRAVARFMLAPEPAAPPRTRPVEHAAVAQPVRRLSFAGTWHSGDPDLAAHSEDIIRDEIDRTA